VNEVLGTRVRDLGEEGGPAWLLSDLHVPAGGGPVLGWLDALLAAVSTQTARVFVLGDLFDSYLGPSQLRTGVWRQVAERFAAARKQGARLWFLHGNRDFLLGPEFERATGGCVVEGGIRCRLAGRSALLLHGDELCQNDLPYQRAKRWLRHPVTKTLARVLPLRASLWVAERARRRSRMVVQRGDQTRFDPTLAAVTAAFATGCELLVFGHIHRPARGPFGEPLRGEYCILPAFDERGIGICADEQGVRYVQAGAAGVERVADPPARTFG
jgi:UDP-2,3-diacylglucosamine hydrolase